MWIACPTGIISLLFASGKTEKGNVRLYIEFLLLFSGIA